MVDRLDQGVGRIIAKLEQMNQLDNTLILFLSDNGASPERPETAKPGFDRPSHLRDGTEIIYTRDKKVMPGPENTYAGIGPMWANASNTPFRYWKKEQFEGGITTPLIVHWPAGIMAEPGSVTHQAGHVIDIMATAMEVAGGEYPARYRGRKITPLEGKSLAPVFRGEECEGHEALSWEHFGARAVRQGRWKLVALSDGPWELYDLSVDRTETKNLADQAPERVKRLAGLWQSWAERANVLPRPEGRRK